MTDLEMTKLCAEAMGASSDTEVVPDGDGGYWALYNPLHDDAQAMALVKKFKLALSAPSDGGHELWVCRKPWDHSGDYGFGVTPNRAIVESVAKMQANAKR